MVWGILREASCWDIGGVSRCQLRATLLPVLLRNGTHLVADAETIDLTVSKTHITQIFTLYVGVAYGSLLYFEGTSSFF